MKSSKLAEYVEKIFFPSNVTIAGGAIIIFYLSSLAYLFNNLIVFLSSILIYFLAVKITKRKIKSETKKFTIASGISMISFWVISLIFPVSPELIFGFLSSFLIIIILHSSRDVWKVSGHAMTYVGVSTVLYILDPIFILSFALLPLVVWSRLKLRRHDFLQVFVGSIVGIFIPVIINLVI